MAEQLPDLIARLRLDMSEMESGVSKASAFGGAIGGALGGVLAAGLGAAFGQVRDFVTGSVDAFAELEDGTDAAAVIFGSSMDKIMAQAETAATTLGISAAGVVAAAGTFGTYGKSAGLAGDELAKFSTDMTGLAGDLASFKGTSPEQAIEAIGAALRGESEPIRAYGVMLDDATLKAQALSMGIYSGTGTLTAQQKVLAAQASILAQTTDAQGNYLATADSTANTQKTLAAVTANTAAQFGTLLAPAFTAVRGAGIDMLTGLSGWLDDFIPRFQGFTDTVSTGLGAVRELLSSGDFTAAIGDALNVEEDSGLVAFLLGLRDVIGGVAAGIGPLLAPIGEAVMSVVPAVMALAPSVLQLVQAFSPLSLVLQALLPVLPVLTGALSTVLSTVLGAVVGIMPALLQLAGVVGGVLSSALLALAPVVAELATSLGNVLGTALTALAPLVVQLAETVGGVLGEVVQALLPVISMLAGILGAIIPVVLALVTPLVGVVQALLPLVGVVGELITTLLPPLLDLFMAVLEPVAELAMVLVSALVPVLNLLGQLLSGIVVPVLSALIGVLAAVITWVVRLAGPVLGGLVGVLSTAIGWVAKMAASVAAWVSGLGGAARAVGDMARAIAGRIGEVVGVFLNLHDRAVQVVAGLAVSLLRSGRAAVQGFIDGVVGMAGRVVSAIKETITDRLPAFVKKALGIASPSKVFRGLGAAVGEGFAEGIHAATSGVVRAAEDMVGAVAGVDVAPPAIAGVTGGGLPTYGARYGAPAPAPAPVYVRVMIGDQELRGIVTTEVNGVLVEEARAIMHGSV